MNGVNNDCAHNWWEGQYCYGISTQTTAVQQSGAVPVTIQKDKTHVMMRAASARGIFRGGRKASSASTVANMNNISIQM